LHEVRSRATWNLLLFYTYTTVYHDFVCSLPHQTTILSRWDLVCVRFLLSLTRCSGAYQSLVNLTVPDPSSEDYIPTLVYQARAHIALHNPKAAIGVIPEDNANVALKAVVALARYVDAEGSSESESLLEEFRDLSVEIEGDDAEGTEGEKAFVRVLAGTAFARAGEIEEALETLGADTEDLEAYEQNFAIIYGFSLILPVWLSSYKYSYPLTVLTSPRKSTFYWPVFTEPR